MKKVLLFLFTVLLFISGEIFAQGSIGFDKGIRTKFSKVEIPTDRKFNIPNSLFHPNDALDVYVFNKFVFITYVEDGVYISRETRDTFAKSFKHAADMFEECIEIPYTIPVIVKYGESDCSYASSLIGDNVVDTSKKKAESKILRGDNDSYIQIWINHNIEKMFIPDIQQDGYYYIENTEKANYLPVVVAHEIFHGLAQNYPLLQNNSVSYGTICEAEGHEDCDKMHSHPTSTNYCWADLYYAGENAVKANGGFPIQTEKMHFNLHRNEIEAISAGGMIFNSKIYIWNHIGPVSLGLLQDVGYNAKQSFIESDYNQEYYGMPSWYILDKRGDCYGTICLGKITSLNPSWEDKYRNKELLEMEKIEPYLGYRIPDITAIDNIDTKEIKVMGNKNCIRISNVNKNVSIQIYNIEGKILKNMENIHEDVSIPIKSGLYLVKVNDKTYKVLCN